MKPFYLDGCWVETQTSEAVHNPWSGEKLADICTAGSQDVESAITSASAAMSLSM